MRWAGVRAVYDPSRPPAHLRRARPGGVVPVTVPSVRASHFVWLLPLVGLSGCAGDANPTVATAAPTAVVPSGFEQVAATATAADGTVCELCLWLAETGEQRRRGLMSVTDLDGLDGMVFRYQSEHSGAFWMKDTVLALSIAFFDGDGLFMDAFDMVPCVRDPCPRYTTPNGFVLAVEAPQGNLASLAIAPGTTLVVHDTPCPAG